MLLKGLFWGSLGALAWTHVGYPVAATVASRLRPRPVRKGDVQPRVSVIVAAWNEEDVIERRLENLLELDYPPELVEIVVASDASSDRTDELVQAVSAREPRVRLVRCPRGGKVAAQNFTVPQTSGDVLAFSDANATWAPDALAKLVRSFADSDVAYVCGELQLQQPDGTNREGAYWRYELLVRAAESALGSITGGNGSIYAVRRNDYLEVDPRFGHDLSFPYRMVQRGRRAVFEPEAVAYEKPSRDVEDEYRRKVRMFEHCWLIVLRGQMFGDLDPVYLAEVLSHRLLRYGSGLLHVALFATSAALAREGRIYAAALAAQLAFLSMAAARPGLPRYYTLVTWATVEALASPVLAAAAVAIKLEDGGPVLYRQRRVGLGGRDFDLLKLRTMVVGAEHQGAGLAVNRGDARITRVGRVLRRLSLDELPQLWNVVRGEMSLIGPRPTLRYQVEKYTDRQRRRLDVRPGITGWAQVNGRASLPWDDRIELDVWYVEHRSPWVDLKIVARTPLALFGGTYKGETGGWRA